MKEPEVWGEKLAAPWIPEGPLCHDVKLFMHSNTGMSEIINKGQRNVQRGVFSRISEKSM